MPEVKDYGRPIFLDHPRWPLFCSPKDEMDLERDLRWIHDCEINQFLARPRVYTREEQKKYYGRLGTAMHSLSDISLAIIEKENGEHIGNMGLHSIDWVNRSATTGALIGEKRFHGKGYGSAAKMLLLRWAFEELGLHTILSDVLAFNGRSAAYNKKCGYREVGRIPGSIFRHGTFHDEIIMVVKEEWWRPLWVQFENGAFGKKS